MTAIICAAGRMFFVDLPREAHPTREETLRRERVAVGRICGCRTCACCQELRREQSAYRSNKRGK